MSMHRHRSTPPQPASTPPSLIGIGTSTTAASRRPCFLSTQELRPSLHPVLHASRSVSSLQQALPTGNNNCIQAGQGRSVIPCTTISRIPPRPFTHNFPARVREDQAKHASTCACADRTTSPRCAASPLKSSAQIAQRRYVSGTAATVAHDFRPPPSNQLHPGMRRFTSLTQ